MKLNLTKALAFFDLETTGTHLANDRIVEICVLLVRPDGSEEAKTWLVNPGKPIPAEAAAIHGFTDEKVKDCPRFEQVAKNIAQYIGNADLAGYNSNKFDIPILMEEFLRAGVDFELENRRFVDVQNIFHQMEQRTLKAAYKFYCQAELENAHSAEADIKATYEVLKAQIERYENVAYVDRSGKSSFPVKNDVDALHKFTYIQKNVDFAGTMVYNEKGEPIFNIGKHKGRLVAEVFAKEPSYYDWMMNGDFPQFTKKKITEIRLKGFNK